MGSFYTGNTCYGTTDANLITTKVGNDTFNLQTIIGKIITDLAPISQTTTTRSFAKGQYLIYNGQFYKVNQVIASGDNLTIGTNIVVADINSELKTIWNNLNKAITGITSSDSNLKFTATKVDGTTIDFTQRDSNTTYSAGNKINISTNNVISHTTQSATQSTIQSNPQFGDSFTALASISGDGFGHYTGYTIRTVTLPSYSNATQVKAGLMSAVDKTRLDNIKSSLEGLQYTIIKTYGATESQPEEEPSEG